MYRDGNDALRSRVVAALALREEALARLAHAGGDDVPALAEIDIDAPGLDLVTVAEDLERDARELEGRAEAREQRSRKSTPPEGNPLVSRGAALARHGILMARLRRIAPLVDVARFVRGERATTPLLERAQRGASDDESAKLVTQQCDAAERALALLGLGDASGRPEDRARDVAILHGILSEARLRDRSFGPIGDAIARYERAVRRLTASEPRPLAYAKPPELPSIALASAKDLRESIAALSNEAARIEAALGPDPSLPPVPVSSVAVAPRPDDRFVETLKVLRTIAGAALWLAVIVSASSRLDFWAVLLILVAVGFLFGKMRAAQKQIEANRSEPASPVRIATAEPPMLEARNDDALSESNRSSRSR